jgi:hypothetical protein
MDDPRNHPSELSAWATAATSGDIEGAILALVGRRDWVTFVELERELEPYVEVRGDRAIELEEFANIIVWASMSAELVDAVLRLNRAGRIHFHSTSALTYLIDGGTLKLPLAKGARAYARPRWAPMCLRTVAPAVRRRRAA